MIAFVSLLAAGVLSAAPKVPVATVARDVRHTFVKTYGKPPVNVEVQSEGPVTTEDKVEHVVEQTRVNYTTKPGHEFEQQIGAEYARVDGKWTFKEFQYGAMKQLPAPTSAEQPKAPTADEVKKLVRDYVEATYALEADGVKEIALKDPPAFSWAEEKTPEYSFESTTHLDVVRDHAKEKLTCTMTYVLWKGATGWLVGDVLCKGRHCILAHGCTQDSTREKKERSR